MTAFNIQQKHVSYPKQKYVSYPTITIEDHDIEVVDDFKFLYIIINNHIKCLSHTESIVNTISKYIGLTNRLKYILSFHILYTLYNTLILSYLYYGILLWGHDSTRLHGLQKRALYTITISK